jgi:hypothetical protein
MGKTKLTPEDPLRYSRMRKGEEETINREQQRGLHVGLFKDRLHSERKQTIKKEEVHLQWG